MFHHARFLFFIAVFAATGWAHTNTVTDGDEASSRFFVYAGWVLHPVWSADGEEFAGFYAHPSEDILTTSGNIQRIWFEVDPADEWWAFAVNPDDFEALIDTIENAGGSPDVALAIEGVLAANASRPASGPSGPIVGGMLNGDPLASYVAGSDDPAVLLDILAGVGYPVASVMSGTLTGSQGSGSLIPHAKAALDCLRAQVDSSVESNSNCMVCACTTHLGTFTPTPPGTWTVTVTVVGNRKKCEYRRNGTAPYWLTGRHWYCPSCTSGSSAAPAGTTPAHEYVAIDVWATDPCPGSPADTPEVVPGNAP